MLPKIHGDLGVELSGHVATIELRRPPHNFFDTALIAALAEVLEALDADPQCRTVVLAAQGKSFCAGSDFGGGARAQTPVPTGSQHIYKEAIRLFRTGKPIVAAVHGAAVGGGLGLACVADFRVTCREARFTANFTRLGFHPGFGLTATLPRLVGPQQAALLFYTGRRIDGEEAVRIGLADLLVPAHGVRSAAQAFAAEIAQSAPLAVVATRETLRLGLADEVEAATEREILEQNRLRVTEDMKEGVRAMAERRLPVFQGR